MSNVTNINSQAEAALKTVLDTDLVINTDALLPDAEGNPLVVGAKYEMFSPAASMAAASLGIVWEDTEHYAFTYGGAVQMQGERYICTANIHYEGEKIPPLIQEQFDNFVKLTGVSPLCPAYVAAKFIRPYSG